MDRLLKVFKQLKVCKVTRRLFGQCAHGDTGSIFISFMGEFHEDNIRLALEQKTYFNLNNTYTDKHVYFKTHETKDSITISGSIASYTIDLLYGQST